MPQIRKALLTILVVFTVVAALVAHPATSSGSARPSGSETSAPSATPPPGIPGSNSGEPDSGSTGSQQTKPSASRANPADQAQFAARALRMIGWCSVVWMKHAMGVSD
jgi:hypothetical protein